MEWLSKAAAGVSAVRSIVKDKFPGNGNTSDLSVTGTQITNPNVHKITITAKPTGSLFAGTVVTDRSQLTNFENLLRTELKSKGWPSNDADLNDAIKQYINSPIFKKYNNGPNTDKLYIDDSDKTIFLFAVLSGMIKSIQFIDNAFRNTREMNITSADEFMKEYNTQNNNNQNTEPYYRFKDQVFYVAEKKKTVTVTITTAFSKIPPPPVKGKGGGTRVRRETRNRNRNHTRRIRTQRHRYRSVKLAKSRKSRR
jgi:hypothetical protein